MAVVVNGGGGSGQDSLDEVIERLKAGGEVVSVARADDIETFFSHLERAATAADIVVVGGGDGSMSAALPTLLRHKRILGLLPMGTANDLARTLGIPPDPLEAADIIVHGRARRIDLGEVNGRPFVNAVSLGFPTDVAREQDKGMKRMLGVMHYPLTWFGAWRRFRPMSARLRTGDRLHRFRSIFMLTIANGRHHGGGMTVDEDARIDDGQLYLYCLHLTGWWRLAHAMVRLRRGKLRTVSHATCDRATEMELTTRRPRPLDVDGEILEETPATFRVLRRALTVMTPHEAGDGLTGEEEHE